MGLPKAIYENTALKSEHIFHPQVKSRKPCLKSTKTT